jgi:hypothetical protein
MEQVTERTRIVQELYARRTASPESGFVEVATLARALSIEPKRAAYICRDLVLHQHVDGEASGNMMGYVRLSDVGVAYVHEIMGMQL